VTIPVVVAALVLRRYCHCLASPIAGSRRCDGPFSATADVMRPNGLIFPRMCPEWTQRRMEASPGFEPGNLLPQMSLREGAP
jgi:hypothetical protein